MSYICLGSFVSTGPADTLSPQVSGSTSLGIILGGNVPTAGSSLYLGEFQYNGTVTTCWKQIIALSGQSSATYTAGVEKGLYACYMGAPPSISTTRVSTVFPYKIRFAFVINKSSAGGVGTSAINIRIGASNTVSDALRYSFTKPGGTAAADVGLCTIDVLVYPRAGAYYSRAVFTMMHNGNTLGHMTTPYYVERTGELSTGGAYYNDNYVGIYITPGAGDVISIPIMWVERIN